MYRIIIEETPMNKSPKLVGTFNIITKELEGSTDFINLFEQIIKKYSESNIYKEMIRPRNDYQISNPVSIVKEPSMIQFTTGLPNIRNSCYINSIIQTMRIVFENFSITLNNSGKFSASLKKLIENLTTFKGVNLEDYNDFLDKLRLENWARGDARDVKEFFTFIIGKLISENNTSIEGLFTTFIQKEHTIRCSYMRKTDKKTIPDSVTVINYTGNSIVECIKKKIECSEGQIYDYPCIFCKGKEICQEKIVPISKAKVHVLYIDPHHNLSSIRVPIHRDVLCFISFTPGSINHFKCHSSGVVFDDDKVYNQHQEFHQNFQNNQELAYLIFMNDRQLTFNKF
jgi:hypothetical protein